MHCWGNCGITMATLVDREQEILSLANKFFDLWTSEILVRGSRGGYNTLQLKEMIGLVGLFSSPGTNNTK